MNPYIGHDLQLYGVEEHRLTGGKGDGMRILEVTNGKGLELTLSPDRALDIARLKFKGINLSYLSPCGFVAPAYYDGKGNGFLKSFTAGFLTTCGLEGVGTPCTDAGEEVPLHGSIANTPADQVYYEEQDGEIVIRGVVRDEGIFARKLRLYREIRVSLSESAFTIRDTIENTGDRVEPFEILYHMNMGYPLLSEDALLEIPSDRVTARNAHAEEDIENCLQIIPPEAGYEERCYYHHFANEGRASITQPKIGTRLDILFDPKELDGFVEWKMMGVRDYVLGLECGNCLPDGRDVMRKTGMLKFLAPGETKTYEVKVQLSEV